MTEETEARIPPSDLARIAVVCKSCVAETTVNLREERQSRAWEENRAFKCGVCQADFDGDVKRALRAFREGLRLLDESRTTAAFRIARTRP